AARTWAHCCNSTPPCARSSCCSTKRPPACSSRRRNRRRWPPSPPGTASRPCRWALQLRKAWRSAVQVSLCLWRGAIMPDKFHDECGVFAIYGHPEASKLAYLGLYALQHRGQESAGICSSDGKEIHCHKSMGHVADIFTPPVIATLPGELAIGHTRYSTAG